jgi:hypothetical protein
MLYISQYKTDKQCKLSQFTQQHCYVYPYTLAGFEPGSSVPQADAMTRAPRHPPSGPDLKSDMLSNFARKLKQVVIFL